MATYKNPWHRQGHNSGPEFFTTNAKPIEYAGYTLYETIPGKPGRSQWDVVKDGVCISQRASRDGAKGWVDILNSMQAKGFAYISNEWQFVNATGETKFIGEAA